MPTSWKASNGQPPVMTPAGLEALVHTKKVIVCVGSGGVGKTTMSAAIALKAAELGKRCVLTIDPVSRERDGLPAQLPSRASWTRDSRPPGSRTQRAAGARMLDTKRMDDPPSLRAESRSRPLADPGESLLPADPLALAGLQEFMAMEKLPEL